jgi:hypothetical protein
MRTKRISFLALLAMLGATSLLHAASDPRGTYKGTLTWTYAYEGAGERPNTSQPLVMTVTDGPAPGSYRVELRQTVSDKVAWKAWDPASNPTVQESWTSNSFVLTQTDGNYTYKLSGAISGSEISGNYADNYKDTLMIGCQFNASRSGGGMFGAGATGSSGGSSSSPTNAGAAGGAFTGTIVGTDANITAGNIRFTVNGSTVQGTVRGKWTLGGSWGSYSYPVNGDYSGSFSGAYDPQTGKFDLPFSGTMAVYPPPTASDPNPTNTTDHSFSGTLHGSIQGGQAQGTWSANYKWGSWTAKWSASGPPPKTCPGRQTPRKRERGSFCRGYWRLPASG